MLPDGRLFIAGPHDPTHRFDLAAPAAAESFATIHGNRSTGGEKGTSVLLMLRPPDYKPIVYIIGGNTPTTQKTAEMIDLSAAAPAWTALPDLNVAARAAVHRDAVARWPRVHCRRRQRRRRRRQRAPKFWIPRSGSSNLPV